MATNLNPQNEQFIQQALAAGRFPDRDALINAAVESLSGELVDRDEKHRSLVEAAIDEADRQGTVPWNPESIMRRGAEQIQRTSAKQ
ncbi:MAG: hypothetical protein JNK76_21105 [Planctomycetales bacterium]|nr:hypothetical protein [Planctomycetales bacterium]